MNYYSSNHLESLCQTLAENITNHEQDIFRKEVIITPNAGMNAWLKTELARRNGIFANFEFTGQDEFFALTYQLLFNGKLRNNKDFIRYKIYELLDGDFKTKFPEVAGYYHDNELRRFQLAEKIAGLFDQYQLYRSEMITGWKTGNLATINSAEVWQQWLWNKLNVESKLELKQRIIQRLNAQPELIREFYPVISVFGISDFSQFYIDFFNELVKYIKVNVYTCLPTNLRATPAEYQNELLVSLGKKSAELSAIPGIADFQVIGNANDSLLAQIQNQILHNQTGADFNADDSLQIASSYTPVREVEALYNYLLDLFEKDRATAKNVNGKEGLKPGDVLVITTDINKYAPYINAVFRNAPVSIPFKVSGAANNAEDSMVAALELLLKFTEDDMTSEKVVSLLEQKRIRKRFGIQDCNYIRAVVRKANIRFGFSNAVEDDTQYVSWEYGLNKILLGYAMLTDEEFEVKENLTLYPFRDAEASESYDLFRLKAFVDQLKSLIEAQKEARTLADWKQFLVEVIDSMVYRDDFDKKDRTEMSSIYKALSFMDQLESDKPLPYCIFQEELKSKLFTESRESRLNTGNVTVSSPVAVKGLPFKVICFLGLNNDIFPAKDSFMGFDLVGEEYKAGDPSGKESDKQLFLDTILATREKLYLSYIGQSVKDNTGIPPSIVLDTLLNYAGLEKSVIHHPLHGFSSAYHKNTGNGLFTYLYGEQPDDFGSKAADPKEFNEISVDSFVKFFEHPIEWYFKNVLGIRYEDNEETLPETELFDLDNLQKWMVKNDLLTLEDNDFESYLVKGKKEGLLPLRNLGEFLLNKLVVETELIRSEYGKLIKDQEEKAIHVALNKDDIRISGTITNIYTKKYITFSLSKSPQKNLVRAYIRTLLLCAQNEIDSAILINNDGGIINIPIFPANEALLQIEALIYYLVEGMKSPLKFTLNATQPPNRYTALSIDTVLESFRSEAEVNNKFDPPIMPSWYMKTLIDQSYFKDFNTDDFEELKKIARLLNLNVD